MLLSWKKGEGRLRLRGSGQVNGSWQPYTPLTISSAGSELVIPLTVFSFTWFCFLTCFAPEHAVWHFGRVNNGQKSFTLCSLVFFMNFTAVTTLRNYWYFSCSSNVPFWIQGLGIVQNCLDCRSENIILYYLWWLPWKRWAYFSALHSFPVFNLGVPQQNWLLHIFNTYRILVSSSRKLQYLHSCYNHKAIWLVPRGPAGLWRERMLHWIMVSATMF